MRPWWRIPVLALALAFPALAAEPSTPAPQAPVAPAQKKPVAPLFQVNFDPPPAPATEPEAVPEADPAPEAENATATAPVSPADPAAPVPPTPVAPPPGRPVQNFLEAQIELARRGFSPGPIDGVFGRQTEAALLAFQEAQELPRTGQLDLATRDRLPLTGELLTTYTVTPEDFARLQPLSATWVGKSEQTALDYETVLELVAERFHASPRFIQKLNPTTNWETIFAGEAVTVPAVVRLRTKLKAAHLHVRLADHVLQARDAAGKIIAHFPVSIASRVEKRPVGELRVVVVIPKPDYTFDPVNFPENEEAQTLTRRLIIAPGPNNPVGVAWVGLDRPGYGIHGTPNPEHVGRTESHGCFRLANWDALTLLDLAWVGLPVFVDP